MFEIGQMGTAVQHEFSTKTNYMQTQVKPAQYERQTLLLKALQVIAYYPILQEK